MVHEELMGLLGAAGPGLMIHNIQQVSITVAAAQTSNTATITAVDTDQTILIFGGHQGHVRAEWGAFTLELVDSTTVRATRGVAMGELTVKSAVVEFSSGIASVQRGITTLASVATIDVDITAIDLAKSFVACLGWSFIGGDWDRCCCNVSFKDQDTITIARYSSTATAKCAWQVVEFS